MSRLFDYALTLAPNFALRGGVGIGSLFEEVGASTVFLERGRFRTSEGFEQAPALGTSQADLRPSPRGWPW